MTSIIIVLGVLSLVATLITAQVYHTLTLSSQLENIEKQLQQESDKTLQRLKQFSLQLGTLIVNSDKFKSAIRKSNYKYLQDYLKQLPSIPFLQSGVISIRFAYIYDNHQKLLSGIKLNTDGSVVTKTPVCHINNHESTTPFDVNDVIYNLCVNQQQPYLSAIIPFHVDNKVAYIELVSEIKTHFHSIDQVVVFPVRIRLPNGKEIYTSDRWPTKYNKKSIAAYSVLDNEHQAVIHVEAIHVDNNLVKALSLAQTLVISGALISIILAIVVSLSIMKQTVISPVNDVVSSLRKVRENREHLGQQINSRGAEEIMALMDDFNAMSSSLNELYKTLEKMTYTDSLTRLGNRKLFNEKIEHVFEHAVKHEGCFALLLIDLDKFKQVNDTYGHSVGDKLLVETSNRFSEVLRQSRFTRRGLDNIISTPVQDLLIRLGGDEFAVILPDVEGKDEASNIATQLAKVIDRPLLIDGQDIELGISIGIALYPDHARDQDRIIRFADTAMYHAKRNGMDFMFYEAGLEENQS
ncbi:MAG: GGDEF domain-containing protein [Gammaproteobacteria bacterium]|nr:GGDEF domain-containing protein [Gammaproteobacteria bacterium]